MRFAGILKKECALAHSRAEARLPRQPSTLAPSAHPRGAFLSYGNEVSYTIKKLPPGSFPSDGSFFIGAVFTANRTYSILSFRSALLQVQSCP